MIKQILIWTAFAELLMILFLVNLQCSDTSRHQTHLNETHTDIKDCEGLLSDPENIIQNPNHLRNKEFMANQSIRQDFTERQFAWLESIWKKHLGDKTTHD